jgi:protein-tyrosine phosphatase
MTDPISHVNTWVVAEELLVTWRGGGDVSVFVSDDPLDAGVEVRAADGPGRVSVPRQLGRYVHLFDPEYGFTVVGERLLATEGIRNFRDLGGYPTDSGGATRWGQVFRSGGLDRATNNDLELIESLGITTVFDLRTQAEVEEKPDRLPSSVERVHLPMSSSVAVHKGLLERILDGDIASYTKVDMAEGYLRMLEAFPNYVAEMVSAVADGQRVLFHCSAGKDRTGITAMVLLGLAGVADGHLLDDYEVSSRHQPEGIVDWFNDRIRDSNLDPDRFDVASMLGAPRPVMRMTIDGVQDRWGGLDGYVDFLGLSTEVRSAARTNLRFDLS